MKAQAPPAKSTGRKRGASKARDSDVEMLFEAEGEKVEEVKKGEASNKRKVGSKKELSPSKETVQKQVIETQNKMKDHEDPEEIISRNKPNGKRNRPEFDDEEEDANIGMIRRKRKVEEDIEDYDVNEPDPEPVKQTHPSPKKVAGKSPLDEYMAKA